MRLTLTIGIDPQIYVNTVSGHGKQLAIRRLNLNRRQLLLRGGLPSYCVAHWRPKVLQISANVLPRGSCLRRASSSSVI